MVLSLGIAVTKAGFGLPINRVRSALYCIIQNPRTSALALTVLAATARARAAHAEVTNSAEKKDTPKYTVPVELLDVLVVLFFGAMLVLAER